MPSPRKLEASFNGAFVQPSQMPQEPPSLKSLCNELYGDPKSPFAQVEEDMVASMSKSIQEEIDAQIIQEMIKAANTPKVSKQQQLQDDCKKLYGDAPVEFPGIVDFDVASMYPKSFSAGFAHDINYNNSQINKTLGVIIK